MVWMCPPLRQLMYWNSIPKCHMLGRRNQMDGHSLLWVKDSHCADLTEESSHGPCVWYLVLSRWCYLRSLWTLWKSESSWMKYGADLEVLEHSPPPAPSVCTSSMRMKMSSASFSCQAFLACCQWTLLLWNCKSKPFSPLGCFCWDILGH